MGYTVEFHNVSKVYKGAREVKDALKNISFSIEKNKILGIIGSNGAGKTTMLKLIANHIFPTEGQLTFNKNTFAENSNIQNDICMMGDQEILYNSYNAKTLFKIASFSYKNWDQDYAEKLMTAFDLKANQKYEKMSKGQKGKVNIIIALASRAKITIFDETYISLDAPSRKKFFDLLIEDYTDNPRTIILSTHYIDEASKVFEDIILIDEGQLLLHESKDLLEEKSITLLGDKVLGEKMLQGINIIHKEYFGSMCAFSIYDALTEDLKRQLLSHGFQMSITPVEKWFIHMISKEGA